MRVDELKPANARTTLFGIGNLIGAIGYLRAASLSWLSPDERALGMGSGEPLIWLLFAVPVGMVFIFVNAVWGWLLLRRRVRGREFYAFLVVCLLWVVTVCIDFSNH